MPAIATSIGYPRQPSVYPIHGIPATVQAHNITIRSLTLSRRVTQEEFARMLGVPLGTLRNWEQGIR
jgi:DNA-binding transcriptional regulator YiaG